ncbi:MAG TPA: DUF4190 domain-containing protein [Gemmataceae bacterium]|jgi:hypothetical protein|nr:DUF4190 domain-containing protein [Gemmataceae bacterium]
MAEPPQANRRAVLSFRLGICSLFLGPLTGIPAILLGWLGLRDVRRSAGHLQGVGQARFGMLAGFVGTALAPALLFLSVHYLLWLDVGWRVDFVFREVEMERFEERQDGMWPTFRAVAPERVYRAAENRWPRPLKYYRVVREGWIMDLPSGGRAYSQQLEDSAKPIIAIGKPAVPHLFRWVLHDDLHVRYVAVRSLEEITGKKKMSWGSYFDREEAIQTWQEWYDNQP